ncbi:hypothetical protein ACSS6W_007684 [Trichoderma asperelloides]
MQPTAYTHFNQDTEVSPPPLAQLFRASSPSSLLMLEQKSHMSIDQRAVTADYSTFACGYCLWRDRQRAE